MPSRPARTKKSTSGPNASSSTARAALASGVTEAARAPRSMAATLSSAPMSALEGAIRDGHVLRVTLARPERRNAFDAALIAELTEAFADVGDARAVVLAGEGPASARAPTSSGSARRSTSRTTRTSRTRCGCTGCSRRSTRARRRSSAACTGSRSAAAPGSSRARTSRSRGPTRPSASRRCGSGSSPRSSRRSCSRRSARAARRYFVTGERFGAEVALRIGLVSEVSEDAGERAEQIVQRRPRRRPDRGARGEDGSCASGRPASRRRRSRPRGARATRARTGCARSSSGAHPAGPTTTASAGARRGTSAARGTAGRTPRAPTASQTIKRRGDPGSEAADREPVGEERR